MDGKTDEVLDLTIEGEIMTQWPEFAFVGATAKATIISDIHGRFVNNEPLWNNLTTFVHNYVETVIREQGAGLERVGIPLVRHILSRWGNLLSTLNVG